MGVEHVWVVVGRVVNKSVSRKSVSLKSRGRRSKVDWVMARGVGLGFS